MIGAFWSKIGGPVGRESMPVEKVEGGYVWKCPYCNFQTKTYKRYETAVNQGIKHMMKMHEEEVLMSGDLSG